MKLIYLISQFFQIIFFTFLLDELSKSITMNRHKKQPFRWSGQMKNLSFFNFDEEEQRRVNFLNQTVLYIDCPRGNEPKAFKAIRDMFGSVFYCDYHREHGKSKI